MIDKNVLNVVARHCYRVQLYVYIGHDRFERPNARTYPNLTVPEHLRPCYKKFSENLPDSICEIISQYRIM